MCDVNWKDRNFKFEIILVMKTRLKYVKQFVAFIAYRLNLEKTLFIYYFIFKLFHYFVSWPTGLFSKFVH